LRLTICVRLLFASELFALDIALELFALGYCVDELASEAICVELFAWKLFAWSYLHGYLRGGLFAVELLRALHT
jgi:O-antigen ligase